jgi:hypothetical protein
MAFRLTVAKISTKADRAKRLRAYLQQGIHQVEGWLDPFSAEVIAAIAAEQRERGLHGGLAEIGVHHGKLFLVLELSREEKERSLAVDLFHLQSMNVDKSGRGSLPRLQSNLEQFGFGSEGVFTLARSSLEVQPKDIIERVGQVRLFSIDGSHTEEATINDLQLAEATLTADGVAIIDDYFNAQFPAVSVGTVRFLLNNRDRLAPFLICPNKLLLARPHAASPYQQFLANRFRKNLDKSVETLGNKVIVLGTIERTTLVRLRRTAIGSLLARLASGWR